MHWRTNNNIQRAGGAAFAALFLMLIFIVWLPAPLVDAHQRVSAFAAPGTVTVSATPTEDATVTALNKEKLQREVDQQQRTFGNWVWSNAATLLSAILSTFVVVIGALFGFWRWLVDRRDTETREAKNRADAQEKELEDRKAERERQAEEQKRSLEDRAEERFQTAVAGLGDDKENARIGAAILLRTFLREGLGYEQFYVQTFDLAVANLRLRRRPTPPEDPDGIPRPPEHPDDTPLPLTTLSQALIVAFKEAFPLAREHLTKQQTGRYTPQTLDATGIQLDNAHLSGTELKHAWMPQASMRVANLNKANLAGANLAGANLAGANLIEADLRGADVRGAKLTGAYLIGANLSRADLSWVNLSEARLTGADLSEANLGGTWLVEAWLDLALLNGANLSGTNFSGARLIGANLSGADLSWADLSGANLSRAELTGAKLYEVRGLTKEQLEDCKTRGGIVDEEEPTTTSSPSPVLPISPSQSTDVHISSVPSAQESVSPPRPSASSTTPSERGSETETSPPRTSPPKASEKHQN